MFAVSYTHLDVYKRQVYSSTSCAAIGVAAHEAGHAVQHAEGYLPIKIRSAIIPATNIGSKLAMPLFIIGLMLSYYGEKFLYVCLLYTSSD